MRPLVHPTSRFGMRVSSQLSGFDSTRLDVLKIVPAVSQAPNGRVIIALVCAEVLRFARDRLWSMNGHTIQSGLGQRHVMLIRGPHDHPEGHAASVGQQRSLCPRLASIRGIWAGFFPHRTVLSPLRHPASANATESRDADRTRSIPASTICETRPAPSSFGNKRAGCCPIRTAAVPLSTGNQSATHNRCHPRRAVHPAPDAHPWDSGASAESVSANASRSAQASSIFSRSRFSWRPPP